MALYMEFLLKECLVQVPEIGVTCYGRGVAYHVLPIRTHQFKDTLCCAN